MSGVRRPRISARDILRRTETLHRAACATGDDFLQYLFGMVLLYLDTRAEASDRPVEEPARCDPQVAEAAKMLSGKRWGN
jgi:hypothetical protein